MTQCCGPSRRWRIRRLPHEAASFPAGACNAHRAHRARFHAFRTSHPADEPDRLDSHGEPRRDEDVSRVLATLLVLALLIAVVSTAFPYI
jgi:hypothetical protein